MQTARHEERRKPGPGNSAMRRTIFLAIICVVLGALCSGVKGGGAVFGAIAGGVLFITVGGTFVSIAWLAGKL